MKQLLKTELVSWLHFLVLLVLSQQLPSLRRDADLLPCGDLRVQARGHVSRPACKHLFASLTARKSIWQSSWNLRFRAARVVLGKTPSR